MKRIVNFFTKENIIYTLFFIYMYIYFFANLLNDNNELIITKSIVIIFVIFLLMQLGAIILIRFLKKKKLPIEKLYLILAFSLLPFYLFAFPQGQIPDERDDYKRSLEISSFHLTSEFKGEKEGVGRELSTNIEKVFDENSTYEEAFSNFPLKLNEETKFYSFTNKALYAFTCYIPQTLGITLGKILNTSIIMQVYLGRFFNYLFFVLLAFFTIKYLPRKKELALFIFLLPITLQETVSLSPDAMIIGISSLFISLILHFKYTKIDILNKKQLLLLSLLAIFLSLCKIVYLPLCLLLFLLPNKCFKSKKHKYIYTILTIIIATVLNLFWLKISSLYLVTFHHRSNSTLQLRYILSNPFKYLLVLSNTLDTYFIYYLTTMVGSLLGPLNIETSTLMVVLSLIVLGYLIISKGKDKKYLLNIKEKIFVSFILLITVLLIFTSLYLQWTAPYSGIVEGIQGRYFLPLLLILSTIFMTKNIERNNYINHLASFIFVLNIMALSSIAISFI